MATHHRDMAEVYYKIDRYSTAVLYFARGRRSLPAWYPTDIAKRNVSGACRARACVIIHQRTFVLMSPASDGFQRPVPSLSEGRAVNGAETPNCLEVAFK